MDDFRSRLDFLLDFLPASLVFKIDVETHEVSVLREATGLLRHIRPTRRKVSEENSVEVTELLRAAGYELQGAATQYHPKIDRAWFHTLAVPSGASAQPIVQT